MSVPTQTSSVRNHDQDRKGCSNNHDPRFAPRPIILITGATGGVGFGICLRLLHQLSQPWQPDLSNDHLGQNTHDEDERAVDVQSVYATPNGLTLLIACRCEARCKEAIAQLRERLAQLFVKENNHHQEQTLHSYIDRQTAQVETLSFPAYRQQWLANLRIESVAMDLYRAQTVLEAIKTITARHGYLSHLLLNAGGGPFVGLDWLALLRALMHNFLDAVTYPDYVLEAPTVCETEDRLTETWQLNLFSHYLLAKHALPLLQQASISGPGSKARIVWTASLDGRRTFFDRSDYQSYHPHRHAYQSSKYQVEIVGQAFHATIQEAGLAEQVTSIVAHPGIVAGNMFR